MPGMELRVDSADTVLCAGGPVEGNVCVGQRQAFDVIVVADGIPANGYIVAQAWIDYGPNLTHKGNARMRATRECCGRTVTSRRF